MNELIAELREKASGVLEAAVAAAAVFTTTPGRGSCRDGGGSAAGAWSGKGAGGEDSDDVVERAGLGLETYVIESCLVPSSVGWWGAGGKDGRHGRHPSGTNGGSDGSDVGDGNDGQGLSFLEAMVPYSSIIRHGGEDGEDMETKTEGGSNKAAGSDTCNAAVTSSLYMYVNR